MIRLRRMLCLFAALGATMPSAALADNFNPAKVIAAMGRVDPHMKIITSHRGSYEPGCPENSVCAITRTSRNNIESVELDVKESREGTLWPMHDMTIGRGTNFSLNGQLFNPFERSPRNEINNPPISSLHDSALRNLYLRDVEGHVTSQKLLDLETLLRVADVGNRNIVYVLDLKTATSVKKAADIVKRLRLQDRVVLKFSIAFFKPRDLASHTLGYHFVPTMYAGNLDHIADHEHLELHSPAQRVFTYVRNYRSVRGFVYYEIGNKEFYTHNHQTTVSGPTSFLSAALKAENLPIGNFIPVVENHSAPGRPGTGFFHTDGHCCTRLIDFLAHTSHFGNETRDDRENSYFQVTFNQNVITDHATEALSIAKSIGGRTKVSSLYY